MLATLKDVSANAQPLSWVALKSAMWPAPELTQADQGQTTFEQKHSPKGELVKSFLPVPFTK